MSDIHRKTEENGVIDLKENLKEMPRNMHIFSLSMRALYTDKAVGTSTSAARKFRKLRDDTRDDAMVYLKCILPITTKFVMSIKEYFTNYDALSYEEWCEMLPDILKETTTYKELAQTVKGMYEEMMVSLKRRQDEAKIIMTGFKDLQRKFEKQKEELEGTAKKKMDWAIGLAFVPYVNMIAIPLLALSANDDMAKAVAKQSESSIQEAAALVVAETLIPALTNFIEGLTKAAGFFQVMETELQSFEENSAIESPKKLHYMRIRNEAKELKSLCQAFYAVLPAVRTDFEAIPDEGTDQNYVDKWLEKQLAETEKKRSMVQKFLLSILTANTGSKEEAK
ncbi:Hypothetical predicted protein [Paramuricea clavata]|uniref:Uncharacterized protein n=1 Tax=Paramuricea clavata TaxID=317549 RepID=A0A7D9E941_PARCT|nr:Hypothetical predicted protein [Paramuricea clavata]